MMMFATALLAAQTLQTAAMAFWLAIGLRDNLVVPAPNRDAVADILRLDGIARDYPQYLHLSALARRRIMDPARHRRLFRLIVAAEALVTLALLLATGMMGAALVGLVPAETARAMAMIAAAGFSAIWLAFLIGGNHYLYWLSHAPLQQTHFALLLWGLGTQVLLILG